MHLIDYSMHKASLGAARKMGYGRGQVTKFEMVREFCTMEEATRALFHP